MDSARVHGLLMEFVRASGLLQLDQAAPDQLASLSQAFALHELEGEVPLSQRELGERLRLEKSSVSRMVAELERKGLIVRERDPHDRRQYRLRLTPQGRAAHAQLGASFHAKYDAWIARLSAAEQAALVKGLAALVRAIHQHHDADPGGS